MKLTQRLLLGSLIIVGVLVLLVVAIVDGRLRARFYEESAAQLLREARLVAAQWHPGLDVDSLADAAGRALGHRVTLIDSTGTVVGDSEFDRPALDALENHLTRHEISEAARTGSGAARRVSASAGDAELYAAVRTSVGFARVSVSAVSIQQLFARARTDVLAAAGIALALALVLAWLFSRSVARPVVELRDVARALAAGDLARRPSLAAPGEVGDLASAVHRLAEQLSSRIEALEAEEIAPRRAHRVAQRGRHRDRRSAAGRAAQRARVATCSACGIACRSQRPAFRATAVCARRSARRSSGHAVDAHEVRIGGRELALTARPAAGGWRGARAVRPDARASARDGAPRLRGERVARAADAAHGDRRLRRDAAGRLLPDEQRRQFAETILANAQRMQRIVDDLLDLSRIEIGRLAAESGTGRRARAGGGGDRRRPATAAADQVAWSSRSQIAPDATRRVGRPHCAAAGADEPGR